MPCASCVRTWGATFIRAATVQQSSSFPGPQVSEGLPHTSDATRRAGETLQCLVAGKALVAKVGLQRQRAELQVSLPQMTDLSILG